MESGRSGDGYGGSWRKQTGEDHSAPPGRNQVDCRFQRNLEAVVGQGKVVGQWECDTGGDLRSAMSSCFVNSQFSVLNLFLNHESRTAQGLKEQDNLSLTE